MQVLVSDMYKYTVTEDDRGRSVYLSSPDGDLCNLGQRVIVEVGAFQHGTLATVLDLLQQEAYSTARGAKVMVERLW